LCVCFTLFPDAHPLKAGVHFHKEEHALATENIGQPKVETFARMGAETTHAAEVREHDREHHDHDEDVIS
jgi:hypothetical protein